jgi:hypothetical protein
LGDLKGLRQLALPEPLTSIEHSWNAMENSHPRPVIPESKATPRLDYLTNVFMAQGWAEDEARKLALIQIKIASRTAQGGRAQGKPNAA